MALTGTCRRTVWKPVPFAARKITRKTVAATSAGHRALGRPDAGTLAPGQVADLVTVRLDSVRTAGAGTGAAAAVFAATALVLSAIYILWAYQRMMTGPVREGNANLRDLVPRELVVVIPLIALLIVFGVILIFWDLLSWVIHF